jgi:hypothetical protein
MRYFIAIWDWLSQARLGIVVGLRKQCGALSRGISTLATIAVLDFEVAWLGRSAISLRWGLLDELILIW